jgi:hypothetical protein
VLDKHGIEHTTDRPFLLLTDGHSSRMSLLSLRFCRDNGIVMYFFPPHATTLYQPLDKCFAHFHYCYSTRAKQFKDAQRQTSKQAQLWRTKPLSRTNAMNIMHETTFAGWLTTDAADARWRDTGMGDKGLDVDANPAILKMLVPSTERMGAAELFCMELGKAKPDLAVLLSSPKKLPTESSSAYHARRGDHFKKMLAEACTRPRCLAEAGVLATPLHCATEAAEAVDKINEATAKFGEGDNDTLIAKFEAEELARTTKAQAKQVERNTNLPLAWLLYLLQVIDTADVTLVTKPRLVQLRDDLKAAKVVTLDWSKVDADRCSNTR